ncbi:MAG TPA: Flp pilus assembly protein CpaB [Sphingomicrobium sp.]|nr:Flp pilus assembly protein CpaB [Sphingomicrobium sp.]
MIALAIAIILGVVAVYVANSYLVGAQRNAKLRETTKVAVASAPLNYGTEITPDKVRFVDFPNTSIPPGAFTTAQQLLPDGKKRVALMPISVNEPILKEKISAEGQGASISALLPEGMRAATVRINDVSGVAGFIQPNDHVDLLITRTPPGGDSNVTDVLLQNIRVIAMGRQAKDSDGKPIPARTATLEVAPIDAQKLALGEAAGSLSLVLRKPGDPNDPVVETVSLNDLRYNMYGGARYPAPAVVGSFGSGLGGAVAGSMQRSAVKVASTAPRPRRRAAPVQAAPVDNSKQIEVYRGTKSDQVKVGG